MLRLSSCIGRRLAPVARREFSSAAPHGAPQENAEKSENKNLPVASAPLSSSISAKSPNLPDLPRSPPPPPYDFEPEESGNRAGRKLLAGFFIAAWVGMIYLVVSDIKIVTRTVFPSNDPILKYPDPDKEITYSQYMARRTPLKEKKKLMEQEFQQQREKNQRIKERAAEIAKNGIDKPEWANK